MLERLGMIGLTWRDGGSDGLAEFKLPDDAAAERLTRFADELGLVELAYLATCNRVEIVFVRGAGGAADLRPAAFELLTGRAPMPGEAERCLKAWQGEGAVEHLFMVTAALDSACLGEKEIVGQVRRSQALARDLDLFGPLLELLYEHAFRVAGRVHDETELSAGRVSLAEIAVDLIRARHAQTGGSVALVGVSPMTERAIVSLKSDGIPVVVVNRSEHKARELAASAGGESLSLEAFCRQPPPVEAVVCATGADEPVLAAPVLERLLEGTASHEPPLLIDLAVPPDIDREACRRLELDVVDMDDVIATAERNRSARLLQAAQARQYVDEALDTFQERLSERTFGPLIGALQKRYQRTAEEGVKRLLKKELKGLGEQERAAIEAWTQMIARRFAHIPSVGLRGLIHNGPEGSLDAFIDGLDERFANELRSAMNDGSARESA
ncbi:MAG: glutamyl-tRNA reductase [Gammaproteobacteria bacterium]